MGDDRKRLEGKHLGKISRFKCRGMAAPGVEELRPVEGEGGSSTEPDLEGAEEPDPSPDDDLPQPAPTAAAPQPDAASPSEAEEGASFERVQQALCSERVARTRLRRIAAHAPCLVKDKISRLPHPGKGVELGGAADV